LRLFGAVPVRLKRRAIGRFFAQGGLHERVSSSAPLVEPIAPTGGALPPQEARAMRLASLFLAAATVAVATACVAPRSHPHGMPPGQAKKLGHVHGLSCGHVLVDGVWIVAASGGHAGRGRK
jgi:hypothetical protein